MINVANDLLTTLNQYPVAGIGAIALVLIAWGIRKLRRRLDWWITADVKGGVEFKLRSGKDDGSDRS